MAGLTRLTGAVALALAAALVGTPGCSRSSVSVCYRAIPVGRSAVHDAKATLVGVHRVPADRVRPHLPPAAQQELTAENDTAVCAMEFKGHFAPGQVDLAPAGESGNYALILVTSKQLQLLASAVLHNPPKGFGGRTA
jgi:hypothetical protein